MESTDLDFEQARIKHIAFKTRLRSILYGADIDQAPVLSQYQCGVGKWIYGHALAAYGHIPEMAELERVHAGIHTCAQQLIALYDEGKADEARQGLAGMDLIANNLIALLAVIELKIKGEKATQGEAKPEQLTIHYQELLDLHTTISDLDKRIKEQTAMTSATKKLAEENENKFRNAVMEAPVGIIMLQGEDMIVEMANDAYMAIVDRRRDEFIGRSIYELLPESTDVVRPIFASVMATGEPYHASELSILLNRPGRPAQAYFNLVYNPRRDADGHISGVIVVATEVTTQVEARMALQQREAQFRNLVLQSPVAMAIFRGPGHIIEIANDTLLRNIWRKNYEDVVGRPLLEVFPELNDQKFPQLMKTVLETAAVYRENEAPAIVNSFDGARKYYLDLEYAPLSDSAGSVTGIMVTVNDVTEKVIARQEIETERKKYSNLIETMPVAMFTIDKDGYVDLYNQAAVQLWGRQPVKGEDMWTGAYKQYTSAGKPVGKEQIPIAIALRENRPLHTEMYVEQPNGMRRHVLVHPQPIRDAGGNAIGAMNMLIDITERIEAQKALSASEQKFRLLANSMPQFIWTGSPDGNLNYFSQSVFDYSGLSEEQVMSEGWLQIVHEEDREQNIALWVAAITTGNNFHYEHRFRRHDGEYRWQLSRALPQKDSEGNIQMWVGTSTDIHDRKLYADELTQKVNERTRELKQSNDHLLRSNSELVQFAYVASHDLQEPLRKIQTFVSRIMDMDYDRISPKGQDYFVRIQKSANRTQRLIQDLLAFSRTNTTQKHFELTDLNDTLDKVKEDLRELTEQKRATITHTRLPVITGISYQMEQLFTNLIVNAVKFARPGIDPVITIKSEAINGVIIGHPDADSNKRYYHIKVCDNGIGFEPQFNERIFQVFQRLHNKDAFEGTGIGLSICRRIAGNHNGFITAAATPGEGAIFDIYLPIERAAG